MPFNSLTYLLFLALSAGFFYAAGKMQWRQWILLLSGAVFMACFSMASLAALLLVAVVNFGGMRLYAAAGTAGVRQKLFYTALLLDIAVLLAYKWWQELGGHSAWILLGMGFYMLQLIGAWITLHLSGMNPSLKAGSFFLSVFFFPKIPSGPLLSAKEVTALEQAGEARFNTGNLNYAVNRIMLGLVKKMVIADRLQPFVKDVFDKGNVLSVFEIYLASVVFTIQLYADFSAYMDIALGSARLFSIPLPENFRMPLRAQSVTDFWRRWHITLVAWLRNHIFSPVSFRFRRSGYGVLLAVAATFLVSALWHGLAPVFFIWALLHFIYLAVEHRTRIASSQEGNLGKKIWRAFLVLNLVSLAHFFFRCGSWENMVTLLQKLKDLPFLLPEGVSLKAWIINSGRYIEDTLNFRLGLLLAVLWLVLEGRIRKHGESEGLNVWYLAIMLLLILTLGIFDLGERFIYMQY